jgi:hypothetical protein
MRKITVTVASREQTRILVAGWDVPSGGGFTRRGAASIRPQFVGELTFQPA